MNDETRERLLAANDPALAPLVLAADDDARRDAIDVIVESVQPLIAAIVRRFRRTEAALGRLDAEDLVSSILLRIVARLQLAAVSEEHAIERVESYVATLTYNALYDDRRRRFPERTRLKNRLRYILSTDARFAAWTSEDDELICGLAAWKNRNDVAPSIVVGDVSAVMKNQDRPADAIAALLAHTGAPVTLTTLLRALTEIWHIHERPSPREESSAEAPPVQLTSLESRQYLETLWREIEDLPAGQRAALLLNMRDGQGGNALVLFLLLAVTSAARIGAAVGMSIEELTEIWEQLPLDDLTIAERLGLRRQQVINLRKAARARLARRTGNVK